MARRVPEFGTKLPVELRVTHVIPTSDMSWLESYLHWAFRHRRTRGEWFRLSDEEVAIIRAIPHADSAADLPQSLIALRESNWLLAHPPKTPRSPREGGSARRRKPGYTQYNLELPDEMLAAVRAAASAAGMKMNAWVCETCARRLKVPYTPPPLGRRPNEKPPGKGKK